MLVLRSPIVFARWFVGDDATAPVSAQRGGTQEALTTLRRFIDYKLKGYSMNRNQPDLDGTSRLSSYLHFGHIGPHTVALAVQKSAPRCKIVRHSSRRILPGTGAQLCAFQLGL